jgi:hypothetical protein
MYADYRLEVLVKLRSYDGSGNQKEGIQYQAPKDQRYTGD